jgi:DNA-binding GntR family transcriptional regulator
MDVCAGPRALALYKTMRPHVERYEWAYGTRVTADYRLSTDEHLAIIAAVEIGDGQLAKRLIEQHWAAGAQRTCATIAPLSAS